VIRQTLVAMTMLVPLSSIADNVSKGKEIFDRKCSQCHTFEMAQAMLQPKPEAERPAHLKTFLETHPPKLNAEEKAVVIEALSHRKQ
jgi:mono/diheme cytochrome c family protein